MIYETVLILIITTTLPMVMARVQKMMLLSELGRKLRKAKQVMKVVLPRMNQASIPMMINL